MIIFVNASNIHTGGGKVLLNDFISATKFFKHINFKFFIDSRITFTGFERINISFNRIKKKQRFLDTPDFNELFNILNNLKKIIKDN